MIDEELKRKIDEELENVQGADLKPQADGFSFTPIENEEDKKIPSSKLSLDDFHFVPIEDDFDPWKIKSQHIEKNEERGEWEPVNVPVVDEYENMQKALESELRRVRMNNSD